MQKRNKIQKVKQTYMKRVCDKPEDKTKILLENNREANKSSSGKQGYY